MGWDILGVTLAFHPVPTEPATLLEGGGEFGALVCVGAAVLGAPDIGGGFPFFGAAVELAEAAAGHLESTLRTNSLKIMCLIRLTARSNCVPLTSLPVLVAWTIMVLPLMGPSLVKVSL